MTGVLFLSFEETCTFNRQFLLTDAQIELKSITVVLIKATLPLRHEPRGLGRMSITATRQAKKVNYNSHLN